MRQRYTVVNNKLTSVKIERYRKNFFGVFHHQKKNCFPNSYICRMKLFRRANLIKITFFRLGPTELIK